MVELPWVNSYSSWIMGTCMMGLLISLFSYDVNFSSIMAYKSSMIFLYENLGWNWALSCHCLVSYLLYQLCAAVCQPLPPKQSFILFLNLQFWRLADTTHRWSMRHLLGKLTWGLEDLLSGWLIHIGCVKEKKYLMTLVKDGKTDFI